MIKQFVITFFLLSLGALAQGQGELVALSSTCFGGSGNDRVWDVCQDSVGNIYVAGMTTSHDLSVSNGAFQLNNVGETDMFLTKLNSDLQVVWSTYFGGVYLETLPDIEISSAGELYLGFSTTSNDLPSPSEPLFQYHGGVDPYISKFDLDGNFIWGRYLGSGFNEGSVQVQLYGGNVIVSYSRNNYPMSGMFPGEGTYSPVGDVNLFEVYDVSILPDTLNTYTSLIKMDLEGNVIESISLGYINPVIWNSPVKVIDEYLSLPINLIGGVQTVFLPDGTQLDASDRILETCFFKFSLDTLALVDYSYPVPLSAVNAIRYVSLDANHLLYVSQFSLMTPDTIPSLVGDFGTQLPVDYDTYTASHPVRVYQAIADTTDSIVWSGYMYDYPYSDNYAFFKDGSDIVRLSNSKTVYPFAVNGSFANTSLDGTVIVYDGDMNLVLSTQYGGSGDDLFYSGMSIGDQTVLAVGASSSIDYPTTANAYQTENAGSIDGILTIFKYNHVGIEELTESTSGYRVYPLPAKESVTIELKENEFVNHSKIFNATGALIDIQSNPSSNQRLTLKTADLPSGLYLVQLFNGNALAGSVKIVVD